MRVFMLVAFSFLVTDVYAHPHGAPVTACETMYPLHKHEAQPSPCPYSSVPLQTEILSNSSVIVKLQSSNDKHPFKGYMTMAFDRLNNSLRPIGTFQVDSQSHTINCFGRFQSAATHSSKSLKTEVDITWIPPPGFEGDVVFMTTWVVSKKVFWLKEASPPVHVKMASNTSFQLPITAEDLEQLDQMRSNLTSFISLWTVYGILIIGFLCAIIAKFIMVNRSKKYFPLVAE